MTDIIVIAVVVLILALAIGYIIKAKKRGVKCVGCSAGGCSNCTGSCGCSGKTE